MTMTCDPLLSLGASYNLHGGGQGRSAWLGRGRRRNVGLPGLLQPPTHCLGSGRIQVNS